jgi:release factor glutamine methyltransferase
MRIDQVIEYGINIICKVSESPTLDCELILGHILSKTRVYIRTWPEQEVSNFHIEKFQELLSRRENGEPIAYILGYNFFWDMRFFVTKDVLIPRPDTETIISVILTIYSNDKYAQVLDLGTGSGVIACVLAAENPSWSVVAADISEEALKIAQKNILFHNLNNIYLKSGSWFNAIDSQKRFDIIVSNPPYIDKDDTNLCLRVKEHEPIRALIPVTGDGLYDIRHIIKTSRTYLKKNGYLFIEHGFEQAKDIYLLFMKYGFSNIKCVKDISNNDRVTYACWVK